MGFLMGRKTKRPEGRLLLKLLAETQSAFRITRVVSH